MMVWLKIARKLEAIVDSATSVSAAVLWRINKNNKQAIKAIDMMRWSAISDGVKVGALALVTCGGLAVSPKHLLAATSSDSTKAAGETQNTEADTKAEKETSANELSKDQVSEKGVIQSEEDLANQEAEEKLTPKDVEKNDSFKMDSSQWLEDLDKAPYGDGVSTPGTHQAFGLWIGSARYDTLVGIYYAYKFYKRSWVDGGIGYAWFDEKVERPTYQMGVYQRVYSGALRYLYYPLGGHSFFVSTSAAFHLHQNYLSNVDFYELDGVLSSPEFRTLGVSLQASFGYHHNISDEFFIQLNVVTLAHHRLLSKLGGEEFHQQAFRSFKEYFSYTSFVPPLNLTLGYYL